MDALDLLKSDHERVKALYGQFKNSSGRQQQILLFDNIRNELEAHTAMEETVFYPAVGKYPEISGMIEHSYKEHQEVKTLLNEINTLPDGSADLALKVDTLMKNVEHHVQEEETELFPLVRKVMKRAERENLGRHMQAAKPELPGIAA
jgi:iron-sulfur cluster repair protein YtfE (RIC family)